MAGAEPLAVSGTFNIKVLVEPKGYVTTVVHVRLFSPFDRLCGRPRVTAEFTSAPTLAAVLRRLVEQYPPLEQYLMKRTGKGTADFEDYFLACVGDQIVLPEDVLPDGAEVKLLVPHAGG